MSTQRERSLQGILCAAEVAASKDDYDTAEDAVREALSEIRKRKSERSE